MKFEPLVVTTPSDTDYYQNPRAELVGIARDLGVSGRVLDAGCGAGAFGEALVGHGVAAEVIGVELDDDAASIAATRLDRVVRGDLGDESLYDQLPDDLDCVVAGDVLEHLVEPEQALKRLTDRLRPGGRWIISVPNVRNFRLIRDLVVRGEWEYTDQGICDSTHLRFFTTTSAVRLCESVGLTPDAGFWLVAGRSGKLARRIRPLGSFAAEQVVLSGTR